MKMQNKAGFAALHPLVHLVYFLHVILFCVFCKLPFFQIIAMMVGIVYFNMTHKRNEFKSYLLILIPLCLYSFVVNPIFNHRGETPLFYINQSPVTLEIFIYGISFMIMVFSGSIWIGVMSYYMSSDRIYYLLGKISSKLALFFSMTLRFIPQLREKYDMIHQGQIALGNVSPDRKIHKIKNFVKEFSILISWSLEDSIELSDSMEARGYGLKGRSFYHLFQFRPLDKITLLIIILLGLPIWVTLYMEGFRVYYFPAYILPVWKIKQWISAFVYLLLLLVPIMIEIINNCRKNK